jgi:hypothetical protein
MANSNSFELTLREHRNGGAVQDLSEELAKVVAGVRATGKAGKLKLTLTIKPPAKGIGFLVVEDDIDAKIPKEPVESSIFYATDDNVLQRNDPQQQTFDLKELPTPKAEVKDLAVNQ